MATPAPERPDDSFSIKMRSTPKFKVSAAEGSNAGWGGISVLQETLFEALQSNLSCLVFQLAAADAMKIEDESSDLFVAYLLARNIRYGTDLVDQLFKSK